MTRVTRRLTAILPLLVCISCTSIVVKPDVIAPAGNDDLVIKAKLIFDGNSVYLPRTIAQTAESDIEIHYVYKVFYDGTAMNHEVIAGLMPTTLLGLPTGGDDILVVAKLDIRRRQKMIKSYTAEAMVSRPRSLFLGGTNKTEMRKKGLLAVKESLEYQMTHDQELLLKLTKEGL